MPKGHMTELKENDDELKLIFSDFMDRHRTTILEFITNEILPPGGSLTFDLDYLGIEIFINGIKVRHSSGEGVVFTFMRKDKVV